MNTAITAVCCLIPCIGLVLGILLCVKAARRTQTEQKPGAMSAEALKMTGHMILPAAVTELVLTLLILFLAPVTGTKPRLVMTILLVTVQYATAMVLIFMINARMPHSTKKKEPTEETEEK